KSGGPSLGRSPARTSSVTPSKQRQISTFGVNRVDTIFRAGLWPRSFFLRRSPRTPCPVEHATLHLSRRERSTRIVRCEAGEGLRSIVTAKAPHPACIFDAIRPLPSGER